MIAAFRRVSLRHFAAHKLRTLFTVGGIALGVATVIAMRLMHESVTHAYERTVERIAGKAMLQVTNGEIGVPEELLDEVKAVPGVGAAVASVQGFVSAPRLPGERLYVFGVDLLADQELREYESGSSEATVEDPLVFLAQPDSVALTTTFLERSGLALEDRLEILTRAGTKELTVRATLEVSRGPASLFDGRLAVMDVFAAQRLFGFDRRFTQIDVGLAEGADLAAVEAAVTKAVGGRGTVERPRARGETLEKLLAGNRYAMTTAALLAVVVGQYLIFNTMMIAVAQRNREIGVLRAIGMRGREVMRLVLVEAGMLGALGCLAGVPMGFGLARGMARGFALNVSSMYLPVETPEIELAPAAIFLGVGLGLLSTLVAALVPAREAVRIHPLEVLRPSSARAARPDAYRKAAWVGAAITVLGLAVWGARIVLPVSRATSGNVAILGLLVGSSLAVPAAVRAFALRAEPLLVGLFGPVGALASRSIVSHLGRVAITCSAFLVSLAGAIAIATWLSSFQRTLTTWMDALFANIDLVISSGAQPLSQDSTPLPGSLAEEIAKMPAISRVDAVRIAKVSFEGSLTNLIATEAELYVEGVREITLLEGDYRATVKAIAAGKAAAVNEAFSLRFGKRPGDSLTLTTPDGQVTLPVAAVYFDPSFADLGVILVDRQLYRRVWRDDSVNFIEPLLAPGADREAVMDEIRRRWGEKHALFVTTIEQFRREADELLNQTMSLSYPLVAISISIALLGVVNSLLASVLDRIREIGVLRALGATRSQVARSIVVEATIIGFLGGALATVVGSVLGYVQLDVLFRGIFGMTVLYRYPGAAVVFSVAAAVVLAALAGYLPGRSAGRILVAEALEYE